MRVHAIVLIGLLLGACAPRAVSPSAPTQSLPIKALPVATIASTEATVDKITSIAIEDLSTRLLLDPAMVRVVSAESQLWPDASLGCPRRGIQYAQQTVPGYQLRLEANGMEYEYHTDITSTVILCMEDDPPSFPVTPGEIDDGEPWMPVD